ncbi:MAG: hypothetical protein M4579_002535 [Chaenotheca gracillima]|nr:MAG: hypothetical protein M4579_002535 [Chaenotheca gracillima]
MDSQNLIKPLLHRSHSANPELAMLVDEEGKPERKQRKHEHNEHHEHHHHRPHRHHHKETHVPQSAVQLRSHTTFGDLVPGKLQSRSTAGAVMPSSSRPHLRSREKHGSVDSGAGDQATDGPKVPKKEKLVTEADLARKREHRRIRSSELKSSLAHLNEVSNQSTRRLDDTYYSILEKLSTLHSTIASLQELSQLNKRLLENVEVEGEEIRSGFQQEIDGFGSFEAQQARIKGLQDRMHQGKEKVGILGRRLEKVRNKVGQWERNETEWQARTSRRLRILWGFLSIVILLFAALLVFQYLPTSLAPPITPSMRERNASMIMTSLVDRWKTELPTSPSTKKIVSKVQTTLPDDGRLRGLDEL